MLHRLFGWLRWLLAAEKGHRQHWESPASRKSKRWKPGKYPRVANSVSPFLDDNLRRLKQALAPAADLDIRRIKIGKQLQVNAALVAISGLFDKTIVNRVLTQLQKFQLPQGDRGAALFTQVLFDTLGVAGIKTTSDLDVVIRRVLKGDSALLVEGAMETIIIASPGAEKRAIEEAPSEPVIRGPRDSFVEDIEVNVSLIRRRLQHPALKVEPFSLGKYSDTDLVIVYLEGIADDSVVAEVRGRLSRIQIDGILASAQIQELINDAPYSPFTTIQSTERPDRVANSILEGRVAILVDNTPFVLIVPTIFFQFLQASEDYYENYILSTFIRLFRLVAINIVILLPSLYVAVVTFHQEMLPTQLVLSLAGSREGVPFPAFVEALIMEATFEILREAGIRLPRPIGQTISIVGALVIGQSAVSAGLISPAVVIVVAFTAIASFTFPGFQAAFTIRFLRFPLIFLAGALGLFGLVTGLMIILIHAVGLRSFGVPYLSPFAPLTLTDLKDAIIRAPWWAIRRLAHRGGMADGQ